MGVPTLEMGYISATTGRGDHEVHKGHVVALGKTVFVFFSDSRLLFHGSFPLDRELK
jgi:hypothetical protein